MAGEEKFGELSGAPAFSSRPVSGSTAFLFSLDFFCGPPGRLEVIRVIGLAGHFVKKTTGNCRPGFTPFHPREAE